MSDILNSYLKSPSKTKNIGGVNVNISGTKTISKPADTVSGKSTSSTDVESKTVAFSTVSDYFYDYENLGYDEAKGKFKTAADFQKQAIAGAAGIGYNVLLTLSVAGKGAQIAVKGAAIGLSTTSLTLGDGKNVIAALGISSVAFALKGTNNGYGWFTNAVDKAKDKIGTSNIFARVANNTVSAWQTSGAWVYKNVYHKIETVNPFHLIPGHHSGFSVIPIQFLEAAATKATAKSGYGFLFGKENYKPYSTGLSAINQLHLQNNGYSSTTPTISLFDYANSKNLVVQPADKTGKATYRQTITITTTTYEPHQNIKIYKPPPKEKTEKEKLEGFITEFDRKKPQNIWYERLQRIFQPQLYSSYDKAKEELSTIKLHEKDGKIIGAIGAVVKFMLEDLAKSIKNLASGVEGSSNLNKGLDYNEEIIQKLAKFKTDIEAAGGKFIIDSSSNFKIVPPVQKELTKQELTTILKPPPKNRAEADARFEEQRRYTQKVQGNVPAIRELVKTANKNAQDLDFRKFINKEYKVNVMDKRLGSNLENIQKLTGKPKETVVRSFFVAYPQYRSKEYKQSLQKDYQTHFYQD